MNLFIFGSTGDLVKRKVLPSLQELNIQELNIYAIGRKNFEEGGYHNFVCNPNCNHSFKERINYIKIDYDSKFICSKCIDLLKKKELNYFYISLVPKLYLKIIKEIGRLKSKGYKIKMLFEKPIGENTSEFNKIYETLKKEGLIEDFFISDHYLFKKKIINLKKQNFKKLKIISTEKIGLEGRVSYYNEIGALKDMIQSHFLGIFLKISKNKINLDELTVKKYIRGQYKDYTLDLDKESQTETFVYLELKYKNIDIVFITGKALDKKLFEVTLNKKQIKEFELNPYSKIFENFFKNKKGNFPKLENIKLAWKIIDKINKNKPSLKYYSIGEKWNEVIKNEFPEGVKK